MCSSVVSNDISILLIPQVYPRHVVNVFHPRDHQEAKILHDASVLSRQ